MGSRYLTDLADVCRAAGVFVVELDGWRDRARSSGGYDGAPVATFLHHTASAGNGAADADYCTFGSDDAPVCNLVVGRDAVVYVCAAGATNTNGKGGALTLPSGYVIPTDSANSRVVGIEMSCDGVGMTYPVGQVDAALGCHVAMAAAYGYRPDDIVTHAEWAPTRKIDPATAAAVEGPWQPASCTSSGTWSLPDLRAECVRRAATPTPTRCRRPRRIPDVIMLMTADDTDAIIAFDGVSSQWLWDWAVVERGGGLGMWDQSQILTVDHGTLQHYITHGWVSGNVPAGYTP